MDVDKHQEMELRKARVEQCIEAGMWEDALAEATGWVEFAQETLSPDMECINAFADALEIRAAIYLEMEEYELAREDYLQGLDQLEGRVDREDQIGRMLAGLGCAHDGTGNSERAEARWLEAVKAFECCEPPMVLEIAAIWNNLAFLAKSKGDGDEAEAYFLKSLDVLHRELGGEHEETATVSSNLGALYQAAGEYKQAREMHWIALRARQSVLGEQHLDTAQSHNNLAMALEFTGERDEAKVHFEQALEILRGLGEVASEELEAVEENYQDFLSGEVADKG